MRRAAGRLFDPSLGDRACPPERAHRHDSGECQRVEGDKVFVDCSGKKIIVADPLTGAVRDAERFVAVPGASGSACADATSTRTLPDRIGAPARMVRFFGAVPRLTVLTDDTNRFHQGSTAAREGKRHRVAPVVAALRRVQRNQPPATVSNSPDVNRGARRPG